MNKSHYITLKWNGMEYANDIALQLPKGFFSLRTAVCICCVNDDIVFPNCLWCFSPVLCLSLFTHIRIVWEQELNFMRGISYYIRDLPHYMMYAYFMYFMYLCTFAYFVKFKSKWWTGISLLFLFLFGFFGFLAYSLIPSEWSLSTYPTSSPNTLCTHRCKCSYKNARN